MISPSRIFTILFSFMILNSFVLKISQEPVSLETPIGEEDDSHLGDFLKDESSLSPEEYTEKDIKFLNLAIIILKIVLIKTKISISWNKLITIKFRIITDESKIIKKSPVI